MGHPLPYTKFSSQGHMDTIKEFFTDDQWDAIDRALADYQDYGDEEAEMSIEIQSKIASLYKN